MSEAVGAVDMASRRIEAVLTTLKAFGRQDDGHLDAVNIKTVVDESVMLVRHKARGKCEIEVDVAADLPLVTASATGLDLSAGESIAELGAGLRQQFARSRSEWCEDHHSHRSSKSR